MGVRVRQKIKGKGNPWSVYINHLGKRKSVQVGAKKAAEAVARKIQTEIAAGKLNIETKPVPAFQEYAERWKTNSLTVQNDYKQSTIDDYKAILKNHVLPTLGNRPVDKITPQTVKDLLLSKLNDGYATSTVTHIKNVISNILNDAVNDETILTNPVYSLKRILKQQASTKTINPLTSKELTSLLQTVQEHYPEHFTFFLLLARTGMRIGEAIALDWRDIDFKQRFIKVQRSMVRGKVSTPKNGKTRKVDVSNQLADALRIHMRGFAIDAAGDGPQYVFTNKSGNPLDKDNWRRRVFDKAIKKAEVKRITPHQLRHSYATLRIAKGDNISDVSHQLGHHSVKLTLDVYNHWTPGGKKEEVDALDDPSLSIPSAPYAHPTPNLEHKKRVTN